MMKRALISVITGQNSSYLSEFLLDKGYEVHVIIRQVALEYPEHRTEKLSGIVDQICLGKYCD